MFKIFRVSLSFSNVYVSTVYDAREENRYQKLFTLSHSLSYTPFRSRDATRPTNERDSLK